MRMISQTLEMARTDWLREHPKNPRRGDTEAIRDSIDANGWYGAVVAQRSTGNILAGNHRYRAAVRAGAEEIPVLWLDVDDERACRILLADNRTNDLAGYDDESLAALLKDLRESDEALLGTGFSNEDLDKMLAELSRDSLEPAADQTGLIESRYEVIVECDTEEAQRALLEKLSREGYPCRALVS